MHACVQYYTTNVSSSPLVESMKDSVVFPVILEKVSDGTCH